MAQPTLEERVAALENKIEQMEQRQEPDDLIEVVPWWKKIVGVFKDDSEFDEAMRLGREYRDSLRPIDYEDAD